MLEFGDDHMAQEQGLGMLSQNLEGPALVENAEGRGGYVIICEHASNHVPGQYNNLGLAAEELQRHIAWDPGALGVARHLASLLDAPLVSCTISRLVIDCNRDPQAVDAIVTRSEDTIIPGNCDLDNQDRQQRILNVYQPFHDCVARTIAASRHHCVPAVLGVHSFTPVYRGVQRPWHVGILYDRDETLSAPMLAALRQDKSLTVGANQPYSPADRVYHTLDRHGQASGLASVMIEVRNDLINTNASQKTWGERLFRALGRR